MLKLNRAAGNQYIYTPDNAVLTYPNSDWTQLITYNVAGDISGSDPQYISSNNVIGAAGINLAHLAALDADTAARNKLGAFIGAGTVADIKGLTTLVPGATIGVVLVRSNGVITMKTCGILASLPTDGSAVVSEGSYAVSTAFDGSGGFYIGSRSDRAANRLSDNAFGRFAFVDRALSDLEIAKWCYGMKIPDLGYVPTFEVDPKDLGSVIDTGPNALPFTVSGTPTVIAEPAYGFRAGSAEPPVEQPAAAVTIVLAAANLAHLQTAGTADVPLSGAYEGGAPTSIEVQFYAADRTTVLMPWAPVADAVIGGGAWSGALSVPTGGPYFSKVRSKNGADVLAESGITSAKFLVGGLILDIGSSSSSRKYTSDSGTGYTPSEKTMVMSGSTPAWAPMSSSGAGTLFAALMAEELDCPIGMLSYGVSGTRLSQWLDKSSTRWQNVVRAVAKAGGKLTAVYITVGSNDVEAGTVTSEASHLANMRQLAQNLRDLTGQPDLIIVWVGSNSRPGLASPGVNYLRMAEAAIGADEHVFHVQNTDLPILASDQVHMTPAGFATLMARAAYVLGEGIRTGAKLRGPKIERFECWGNQVRGTVLHRNKNANALSPPSGFSGFAVTVDGTAATITSSGVLSGSQFELLLDRSTDGAAVVVTYQAGGAPNVTAPVFDNGTLALPMVVETSLATTPGAAAPDTTAPVMTGAISIANITTSGATLSFQAATDDVGVAGYEYSINGGASYVNAGLSRSFAVTTLTASTTYQVRVRAYDAAGNRSTPLSTSFTTLANEPPVEIVIDATKIPASRKVVFPGGTRVVPFGTRPDYVVPDAPSYRDGKWWVDKVPEDERYYVADISIDIAEMGTTATKVEPFVAGVKVLEQPVIQGALIPVKLGGFDTLRGALNFCTFRVTLANGEQIDRTLWFSQVDGRWFLEKDPEDKRYYVADVGNDLADSMTTVTGVTASPVGVVELIKPQMQGSLALIKVGGMDTSADPLNYCRLRFDCASGEVFHRTIHFTQVDN